MLKLFKLMVMPVAFMTMSLCTHGASEPQEWESLNQTFRFPESSMKEKPFFDGIDTSPSFPDLINKENNFVVQEFIPHESEDIPDRLEEIKKNIPSIQAFLGRIKPGLTSVSKLTPQMVCDHLAVNTIRNELINIERGRLLSYWINIEKTSVVDIEKSWQSATDIMVCSNDIIDLIMGSLLVKEFKVLGTYKKAKAPRPVQLESLVRKTIIYSHYSLMKIFSDLDKQIKKEEEVDASMVALNPEVFKLLKNKLGEIKLLDLEANRKISIDLTQNRFKYWQKLSSTKNLMSEEELPKDLLNLCQPPSLYDQLQKIDQKNEKAVLNFVKTHPNLVGKMIWSRFVMKCTVHGKGEDQSRRYLQGLSKLTL